jgi:hypothetical protein
MEWRGVVMSLEPCFCTRSCSESGGFEVDMPLTDSEKGYLAAGISRHGRHMCVFLGLV